MESTEDTRLCVTCPKCGATIVSRMQMDQGTFAGIRVEGMLERCPSCHGTSRFDKTDYRFE